MPELPEVERFRQILLPLKGGILTMELCLPNPPKTFLTEHDLDLLNGNVIVQDVVRKGKLIAMILKCHQHYTSTKTNQKKEKKKTKTKTKTKINSAATIKGQSTLYLFLHMGMTGRISSPGNVMALESQKDTEYPPKYTYLKFFTSSSSSSLSGDQNDDEHTTTTTTTTTKECCFSDPRKFGKIHLATSLDDNDSGIGFGVLAPDAWTEQIDPQDLVGHRLGIKALLLDQKRIMSGVGNWVADEVLYQSEIHPDQTYLTSDQATRLVVTLKQILRAAIESKASALPEEWLFHSRWSKRASTSGEKIKDARGRAISFITSGSRTSAIVPSIQKLKVQVPKKKQKKTKKESKPREIRSNADETIDDNAPKKDCLPGTIIHPIKVESEGSIKVKMEDNTPPSSNTIVKKSTVGVRTCTRIKRSDATKDLLLDDRDNKTMERPPTKKRKKKQM